MRGIIKFIKISEDGNSYGYIAPEEKIPNYDKDISFNERNLTEIPFSSLKQNMEVEFVLDSYNDTYYARNIAIVQQPISKPVIKSVLSLNRRTKIDKKNSNKKFTDRTFIERLNDDLNLIKKISDPYEFEDAVFCLLRLMGIHSVYQYPRQEQAGRADGCFVLENLVVMYDCTLRECFEEFKEEQIENYVNKLSNKSQLTVKIKKADGGVGSKELKIKGKRGQVWIVTKGTTRELKDYDGIKVKEVSVQDLIEISIKRCKQLHYDIDFLSNELVILGM